MEPQETSHLISDNAVTLDHANAAAVAAERRIRQAQMQTSVVEGQHTPFDENHAKRQNFRRLIDPGILRPNSREIALQGLQTLKALAGNILRAPDEPKFQRFKSTNANIKRSVMEPKGTLEYARALGFEPQVESFQPFYVFNKRYISDLRIGAVMLDEALERELTKEQRSKHARELEKAAAEAAKATVKQAFLDDRKSRALQERREKERRAAIVEVAARHRSSVPSPGPSSPPTSSPGPGRTLGESDDNDTDYNAFFK